MEGSPGTDTKPSLFRPPRRLIGKTKLRGANKANVGTEMFSQARPNPVLRSRVTGGLPEAAFFF